MAAIHYYQAGYRHDAARCYRLAGAFRRAAELHEQLGEFPDAAADYRAAGMPELGGWMLAHHAGEPATARALLGSEPDAESDLRRQLVLARCDLLEGARPESIRPVISAVCTQLADRTVRTDQHLEDWAVALCESAHRYDQAAIVFAAAVRGGRYGAEQRWNLWSVRTLGTEVILPEPEKSRPQAS